MFCEVNQLIYFDNAASAPPLPQVRQAIADCMAQPGNASSLHAPGRAAKQALETARGQVAGLLGANPDEVYFTSGGTEAIHWALHTLAASVAPGIILTTPIEHHAVSHTLAALTGHRVQTVPVDAYGVLRLEALERALLQPDVRLVAAMAVNNETGSVLQTAEIGAMCAQKDIPFFVDAVQAAGHTPINAVAQNITALAISGHKFGGPLGTGALVMRRPRQPKPIFLGGAQERNLRAGTENLPGIVGLGLACTLARQLAPEWEEHYTALRRRMLEGIAPLNPIVNGDGVPNILSLCFRGLQNEALHMHLDLRGIAISLGAACGAGNAEPSHVLAAMGMDAIDVQGTIRVSFGPQNTLDEADAFAQALCQSVTTLRAMSPVSAQK